MQQTRRTSVGKYAAIAFAAIAFLAPAADAKRVEKLPPAWRTWLEVCSHEQPKPGIGFVNVHSWATPNWSQTANYSYPGGCGVRSENYRDVAPAWFPDSMSQATPAQQLWICHWLFWKYARIGQKLRGSYEAGQRYGATVWDVHTAMGWHGFKRDGVTWQ